MLSGNNSLARRLTTRLDNQSAATREKREEEEESATEIDERILQHKKIIIDQEKEINRLQCVKSGKLQIIQYLKNVERNIKNEKVELSQSIIVAVPLPAVAVASASASIAQPFDLGPCWHPCLDLPVPAVMDSGTPDAP